MFYIYLTTKEKIMQGLKAENIIYADNASTTRMCQAAKDAVTECMDEYFGNPSSLHIEGQRAARRLLESRQTMARLLNCSPSEIYFTSGGSESDTQALVSAAAAGAAENKKHIISTAVEHHAVLNTLSSLQSQGFEITLLPVDRRGMVDPAQLEKEIRADTALVSVMYANNEIGTIQPVNLIGKICKAHSVPFHTDAVQAAGILPTDVHAQNIDMLSLSAHKFHGPRGTGLLYAKKGTRLTSIIEGGAQERGKRAGTENLPAIAGMAAAFEEACRSREVNAAKITALRDRIISALLKIPHSMLNGPAPGEYINGAVSRLPGNINMCFEGVESEPLLLLLSEHGICASAASACSAGSLEPSHVLLATGVPYQLSHNSLRLSLSAENTEEEADAIINTIPAIISELRALSPTWKALQDGRQEFLI